MQYSDDGKELIMCEDKSISSFAMPNPVTSTGDFAFSCCPSLIHVTAPDSVELIDYGGSDDDCGDDDRYNLVSDKDTAVMWAHVPSSASTASPHHRNPL